MNGIRKCTTTITAELNQPQDIHNDLMLKRFGRTEQEIAAGQARMQGLQSIKHLITGKYLQRKISYHLKDIFITNNYL